MRRVVWIIAFPGDGLEGNAAGWERNDLGNHKGTKDTRGKGRGGGGGMGRNAEGIAPGTGLPQRRTFPFGAYPAAERLGRGC